eukprot:TRINITY_DN14175_c0_g1_i1.p1 TRINITY_DN14175_c0_g1~~TRINITY_DN14175_c0_g1_i1.p1  ORF type:complete len:187 (+),score=33.78 TRINITY_DN14175_c0_g1_i1:32-592(+)
MKVTSRFVGRFHLDPQQLLLPARCVQIVWELFTALDMHHNGLDDVQFLAFLRNTTDLEHEKIMVLFDTFDVDASGNIDFEEFYLLFCMLVAIKDGVQQQFLYKHAKACFSLLDEDNSGQVSVKEFQKLGFLFGFTKRTINQIFGEFDVSGNDQLDQEEFRMFTLAAIERERERSERVSSKSWCSVS